MNTSRHTNNYLIFHIRKLKQQKKWTKEEDKLLISLGKKYNEKNWKEISKHFLNKNYTQCICRYERKKPEIKKGSWKRHEDKQIIEMVNIYGKAWSKIAKQLKFRNAKQIRERYLNKLDPEIKRNKFAEDKIGK